MFINCSSFCLFMFFFCSIHVSSQYLSCISINEKCIIGTMGKGYPHIGWLCMGSRCFIRHYGLCHVPSIVAGWSFGELLLEWWFNEFCKSSIFHLYSVNIPHRMFCIKRGKLIICIKQFSVLLWGCIKTIIKFIFYLWNSSFLNINKSM